MSRIVRTEGDKVEMKPVQPVYIDVRSQFSLLRNYSSIHILNKIGGLLTIKIWNGIRSTLCCGVDSVSDDMPMKLAVPFLNEGHGAPVRYTPKGGTKYRTDEVSCTYKRKRVSEGDGGEKQRYMPMQPSVAPPKKRSGSMP